MPLDAEDALTAADLLLNLNQSLSLISPCDFNNFGISGKRKHKMHSPTKTKAFHWSAKDLISDHHQWGELDNTQLCKTQVLPNQRYMNINWTKCTEDMTCLMHWWYTGDMLISRWWCTDYAMMMHWWYTDDTLMMHWWYTDDALMKNWRTREGRATQLLLEGWVLQFCLTPNVW